MMLRAKLLVVVIVSIFIAGCYGKKPEEYAVEFLMKPNYELVAESEKKLVSAEEFEEYFDTKGINTLELQPSDEFFAVEKYLKSLITVKVISTEKKDNDKTLVKMELNFPEFVQDFSKYTSLPTTYKELEPKIRRFAKLVDENKVNRADLKFTSMPFEQNVLPDGVFLDFAALRVEIDKKAEVEKKIGPFVKEFTELVKPYDQLFKWLIYAKEEVYFENILNSYSDLDERLKRAAFLKEEIEKVDPEAITYAFKDFIERATKAVILAESYSDLKNKITYKELSIEKSEQGPIAIFGKYEYKGRHIIRYAHAKVIYYDGKKNEIGRQDLEHFFSDLRPNGLGSFGNKVEDQYLATKAKSFKIVPVSVF